ncbi:Hint domain-containing protein [Phaeobacter sp. B1627]|uniref:Hint domain-containing protein n=1 Tax=Phaeobacter sp. B1627 TaxID=2583809 RepID=UPI0011194E4D|nr:Hint domain-containing protein [Phaeobacter sp. B1627]TNJ48081.1 Hint domain-containing protein [Phaeobacter sp. B1627]
MVKSHKSGGKGKDHDDDGCGGGGMPCFTPGVRIATKRGAVAVEDLRPGDLLQTADNGYQPVLWVGRRDLTAAELDLMPELRPVKIRPGSPLGNSDSILVSPQHRFFIRRSLLGDLSSLRESFLRARLMCQVAPETARVQTTDRGISYLHVLTPQHEVIFADGIATETLWPGPMALRGLSTQDQHELFTLFPDLRTAIAPDPIRKTDDDRALVRRAYGGLARPDLTGSDLRALNFMAR